ncbi:MAG TPA: ABC transporter permease [Aeromonadales bacterium]|nr:ABC transporter permease [Aeromonadales bacterium]
MKSLRRIYAIFSKELKQLRRDRVTFAMIVMIPLIQLLLFGYAINTDVRNIPIGVVDLSGSSATRLITEVVKVTQVVNVVAHYDTPKEAEAAIVRGDIRAALIFPEDLTQRITQGDVVGQIVVDGSDAVVSGALLQLRNMPLDEIIIEPGLNRAQNKPTFEVALFFNPERRSAVNIVPGLVGIILTMTMILFTSAAIVRERERGNLELLITTPIHSIELMIGKIIPYIAVGLIQVFIILGLGHIVFHVPINGTLLNIFLVSIIFIAASLTLGLFISTIAKTQLQAMQMTIFILLPSILLSGFMFPYEAMPQLAQHISEVLPATHFMRMIRAVVLKGAETSSLNYDTLWLLIFTVSGLIVSSLRFNKRLD